MENGLDDDTIRGAIDDALRADLGDALAGVLHDLAPAGDDELAAHLGAVIGLIGQEMSQGGRAEFIFLATSEFLTMPGFLVLDALRRARRKVTNPRVLVAWVSDDVEAAAARLTLERDRLTHLANLASA